MRPGVKLDFRAKPDGHVVSAAEVQREFDRIGYQLQPFDIVLVNTSARAASGRADFLTKGCGMGVEATLFLTVQGVRVVRTDAWSWEAPFAHRARSYAVESDPKFQWEGHQVK